MKCLAVAILSIVACPLALAADPPKPTTITDPNVATTELDWLCRPLTKAELAVEAEGWLGVLKAKVAEISQAEIAAGKLQAGEEKTRLIEAATKLREERTRIIDRLNTVLAAFKSKGGATADHDAYVNAVSGITVPPVTDAAATWTVLSGWLKSPEGGLRYAKNVGLFVITLVVFQIIGRAIGGVVGSAMGAFKNVSSLLRDFAVNAIRKVTIFIGFVVALSMLEVNIGPFLAAMGAVGFIIGFALQGTLSNFAAGIMILLYRPYDIGDKVTVAGTTGVVSSMTLVSTVLTNDDKHMITIPNSAIWGGTISNQTPGPATAASMAAEKK